MKNLSPEIVEMMEKLTHIGDDALAKIGVKRTGKEATILSCIEVDGGPSVLNMFEAGCDQSTVNLAAALRGHVRVQKMIQVEYLLNGEISWLADNEGVVVAVGYE